MVNKTNASLAEILKQEVENKGIGILSYQYLVNILTDYQVFKEQPALKNIIKSMQDNGFIGKITSANIWSIDSRSLAIQFARENGFQLDLVLFGFIRHFE